MEQASQEGPTAQDMPGVCEVSDCNLWFGAVQSKGYPSVGKPGVRGRTMLLHRKVYEAAHGPIPTGVQIHHTCGNKRCIRLEHLEAVTALEHAGKHSKLSDDDVRVIKVTFAAGTLTMDQIARHFAVHRDTVRNIVKGRRRAIVQPLPTTKPL